MAHTTVRLHEVSDALEGWIRSEVERRAKEDPRKTYLVTDARARREFRRVETLFSIALANLLVEISASPLPTKNKIGPFQEPSPTLQARFPATESSPDVPSSPDIETASRH